MFNLTAKVTQIVFDVLGEKPITEGRLRKNELLR